jgi:hypothetical protein
VVQRGGSQTDRPEGEFALPKFAAESPHDAKTNVTFRIEVDFTASGSGPSWHPFARETGPGGDGKRRGIGAMSGGSLGGWKKILGDLLPKLWFIKRKKTNNRKK